MIKIVADKNVYLTTICYTSHLFRYHGDREDWNEDNGYEDDKEDKDDMNDTYDDSADDNRDRYDEKWIKHRPRYGSAVKRVRGKRLT